MVLPLPKSLLISLPIFFAAASAVADGQRILPYRDFQVYVTSTPSAADSSRIHIDLAMHNRGEHSLPATVVINKSRQLKFAGGKISLRIPSKGKSVWRVDVAPTEPITREVLTGSIKLGDKGSRDLFIAVRGPDPADFENEKLQRLTESVNAVAVYVPRTAEAVEQVRRDFLAARPKSDVVIASRGVSQFALVIEPSPEGLSLPTADHPAFLARWKEVGRRRGEPELIDAVDDLLRIVELQSGAKLKVSTEAEHGIRLRLRDTAPGGQEWPHVESYRLAIESDVLIESSTLEGIQQGIYGLLTNHMDCHWFLPRGLGEEIILPAEKTIRLPRVDAVHTPSFFSSTGMSWSNARRWDRRNRAFINRGRMVFGHAWSSFINRNEYPYEQHPEMWARDVDDEVRVFHTAYAQTNFCSTNPAVIDVVSRKANERLSSPDALVTSLDPEDYAPMCLCERCRELDETYGVSESDGTFVTDRLLHFSNQVFQRLDEKNKGKFLGILVYGFQMELPVNVKPHPNHTGLICNMPWQYDHTRPFNDPTSPRNLEFHRLLQGWGKILSQYGFYDYYGHWSYWGPWGMVQKMREDLPAFRDLGGTYLMIESQPNFAMHGLNLYIASRLAWDVDLDVDLLVDEFCRKFYGPAAEPMRQYWQAIDRQQALTRPGSNVHLVVARRQGLYEELFGHLDRAVQLAVDSPQRYRDRVQFARDGLLWGQRRASIEVVHNFRLFRPGDLTKEINKGRDYSQAIQLMEQNREFFRETIEKYGTGGHEYWPALTPAYFVPQIDRMLEAIKKLDDSG